MGNVHGRRTNEWRFAVGVRVNLRRAGFARKSKYDCYYYCARRPARDGHCAKKRPAETCSVPAILPSHVFEKNTKELSWGETACVILRFFALKPYEYFTFSSFGNVHVHCFRTVAINS